MIALLQNPVGVGDLDVVAAHHARYYVVLLREVAELLAIYCWVLHLAVEPHQVCFLVAVLILGGRLLVHVYLENCAQRHQQKYGPQHAQRVADGVCGGNSPHLAGGLGAGAAQSLQRLGERLLRGTHTGGVGHGTRHHARHNGEILPGNPVDGQGGRHRQNHKQQCHKVHRETVFSEGAEETRAHLQSDGEHK